MKKALITGSFDPPTLGHLDLIERSAELFDQTVVCIFVNSEKNYMFGLEKRKSMLEAVCARFDNVTVDACGGLVADYAAKNGIDVIVKGARNGADFDYECMIARVNNSVFETETVILPCRPGLEHVSSTAAREMIKYNGNLEAFLPREVIRLI